MVKMCSIVGIKLCEVYDVQTRFVLQLTGAWNLKRQTTRLSWSLVCCLSFKLVMLSRCRLAA